METKSDKRKNNRIIISISVNPKTVPMLDKLVDSGIFSSRGRLLDYFAKYSSRIAERVEEVIDRYLKEDLKDLSDLIGELEKIVRKDAEDIARDIVTKILKISLGLIEKNE